MMSDLGNLLVDIVSDMFPVDDVALFLSGGIDSTTVGLACHHAGKRVHAYTFDVDGIENYDSTKAREIADIMGWRHTSVTLTDDGRQQEDVDYMQSFGFCSDRPSRIIQLYPQYKTLPHITEQYVTGGFGQSIAKSELEYSNNPLRIYPSIDEVREDKLRTIEVTRQLEQWLDALSQPFGITTRFPFLDTRFKDYFWNWTYVEATKGYPKHYFHNAFPESQNRIFGKLRVLGHCEPDTQWHVCTHRHLVGYY